MGTSRYPARLDVQPLTLNGAIANVMTYRWGDEEYQPNDVRYSIFTLSSAVEQMVVNHPVVGSIPTE